MTRRLIIRPEAEADIARAALWYQHQRPELGADFVAQIRAGIESAVAHPGYHRRLRRRPEVRRVLTDRFPYRVFFIVRPDAIIIFCVLHSARHDSHWKKTMPSDERGE